MLPLPSPDWVSVLRAQPVLKTWPSMWPQGVGSGCALPHLKKGEGRQNVTRHCFGRHFSWGQASLRNEIVLRYEKEFGRIQGDEILTAV